MTTKTETTRQPIADSKLRRAREELSGGIKPTMTSIWFGGSFVHSRGKRPIHDDEFIFKPTLLITDDEAIRMAWGDTSLLSAEWFQERGWVYCTADEWEDRFEESSNDWDAFQFYLEKLKQPPVSNEYVKARCGE